MATTSNVSHKKIVIYHSEAQQLVRELKDCAKRDGKSGFSTAETREAHKILQRHGIMTNLNHQLFTDLQKCLDEITRVNPFAFHCNPGVICLPGAPLNPDFMPLEIDIIKLGATYLVSSPSIASDPIDIWFPPVKQRYGDLIPALPL